MLWLLPCGKNVKFLFYATWLWKFKHTWECDSLMQTSLEILRDRPCEVSLSLPWRLGEKQYKVYGRPGNMLYLRVDMNRVQSQRTQVWSPAWSFTCCVTLYNWLTSLSFLICGEMEIIIVPLWWGLRVIGGKRPQNSELSPLFFHLEWEQVRTGNGPCHKQPLSHHNQHFTENVHTSLGSYMNF